MTTETKAPKTQTFWLSFCDGDRPVGQQFLGVCVIDVNEEEAAAILPKMLLRFPMAQENAEWIAAATRKAHEHKCNPGGQVLTFDITGLPQTARYERNRASTHVLNWKRSKAHRCARSATTKTN